MRGLTQLFKCLILSLPLQADKSALSITTEGCAMKRAELDRMNTDDLWSLHVEVSQLLQQRMQQEKLQLDERLKRLQTPVASGVVSERRPYPPVLPKYFNPDQPSETWSGRGKRPRWLVKQLKSGRRVEDFRIQVRNKRQVSGRRATRRQRA
jgi:DNA-binding protein H-NS